MALEGKTSAEAAGIKVEGDNKWMTRYRMRVNLKIEKTCHD
jgi:hypothetical protein